jgi:peptidoglycan/xylan/chitin deacetylase (PgdA/CDA1 family)
MAPRRRIATLLTLLLGAVALFALLPAQSQAAAPTTVSITWDDTFEDSAPALDLMAARNMPGTLYVNSNRVDFGPNYLTKAQLKGYFNAGFEIGGHTLSHVDLTSMTAAEAEANICQDRLVLANQGYRPTSFAYPFGAENAAVQQAVKNCGYNSGRKISDLRSPASCSACPTAETMPPPNKYGIRTPASIRSSFTLADMQSEVLKAENDRGGWVPLVFHHICDPNISGDCTGNAIPLSMFRDFIDWLGTQSAVTVKTVDAVIGGAYTPPANDAPPSPEDDAVIIGSATHPISAVNAARCSGCLVEYTRGYGTSTRTNAFGTEVSVVSGKVTAVQNSVGNMTIPTGAGDYVLSGHGESATWLKTYAKVGATVTTHSAGTPPPPPPPSTSPSPSPSPSPPPPPPPSTSPEPSPAPVSSAGCPAPGATSVMVGTKSTAISGFDVVRRSNFLVVYTPATGSSTGTNEFGFEAAVVDGKVTQVANSVGNMTIPANGCVLSGHGTMRTFLQQNAIVGAAVK